MYFIGGITRGEIEALRILSKNLKKDIIIATTNITNCNKLLGSITEEKFEELSLIS